MEIRFRSLYLSYAVLLLFLARDGLTYSYDKDTDGWVKYFIFIPVDSFARVDLCGSHVGLDLFFAKLKTRLCTFNDAFIDTFLSDLCYGSGSGMLIRWVSEIFDKDGDGYVSYHEQLH